MGIHGHKSDGPSAAELKRFRYEISTFVFCLERDERKIILGGLGREERLLFQLSGGVTGSTNGKQNLHKGFGA